MAPAIRVENLSKRYRITQAGQQAAYRTLRESLLEGASTLVRRPQRGQSGRRVQDFWALKGVAFEVDPGEVVGVIGRNGAGKSTLLKILSRITEPTDGRVRLRGRVGSLLEVGTGFHPELSGRENIYLNGAILGMSRRDITRRFDEIVAFAEISEFLDTPVKRYSSGMYVRLAFAVAAHLEPEILIIDEVLAVGDASFQRKCLGKVRSLAQGGGRTVLFVSHNLTTVRSLCSRVISLKSGSITWDGDVGPAVEQYLTADLGDSRICFDVGDTWRNHVKETPVRILRITFNEGHPLRHGEPMTIDIDYRTDRAVEAVSFGIGFSNLEGSRVLSIDTDIPGERRLDLPADITGRIRIVDRTNHLQPARYALVAGSRSGNYALDYLPHFAHVEVLEGDNTPAVIVGRNEAGSVRKPVEWSHEIVGNADGGGEGGILAAGVRTMSH